MEWSDARPVLEVVYGLLAASDETTPEAVCQMLGRPPGDPETTRVLGQLFNANYIAGPSIEESAAPLLIESTEKGLQQVSGWPSSGADSAEANVALFLQILDERISDSATADLDRGRLQRVRDAVADATPRFLGELLAAYTAKVLPPIDG